MFTDSSGAHLTVRQHSSIQQCNKNLNIITMFTVLLKKGTFVCYIVKLSYRRLAEWLLPHTVGALSVRLLAGRPNPVKGPMRRHSRRHGSPHKLSLTILSQHCVFFFAHSPTLPNRHRYLTGFLRLWTLSAHGSQINVYTLWTVCGGNGRGMTRLGLAATSYGVPAASLAYDRRLLSSLGLFYTNFPRFELGDNINRRPRPRVMKTIEPKSFSLSPWYNRIFYGNKVQLFLSTHRSIFFPFLSASDVFFPLLLGGA